MKRSLMLGAMTVLWYSMKAQVLDSIAEYSLNCVEITASKKQDSIPLAFVQIYSMDSLSSSPAYGLSDMLALLPGISELSTGPSISKPVIRGLYGNRILTLVNGLRFSNQQWQDEHGLSLSDLGIGSVGVIKGPSSVFYGSQAIGGLIDLRNADEAKPGTRNMSVDSRLFSNTVGGRIALGYKRNNGLSWHQLHLSYDSEGDYSDGNNKRVLNSRYKALNAKASFGFKSGRWTSNNSYSLSSSQSGFIFNDVFEFIDEDRRLSRLLTENPSHLVDLHLFSTENIFRLHDGSRLTVNGGYNYNRRRENEGGDAISLDMELTTYQYMVRWKKRLSKRHELIVSNMLLIDNNKNYGKRKIIPDALYAEGNFSVVVNSKVSKSVVLQNGISYGVVGIKTLTTEPINTSEDGPQPFERTDGFTNVYSSVELFSQSVFELKTHLSTGTRIPNLAELSSYGLHEGVYNFEIGNPEFNKEVCYSINLESSLRLKKVAFGVNPYFSYFKDFVYLRPTNEEWYGFPVWRYDQKDSRMMGIESALKYGFTENFTLHTSHEFCEIQSLDGDYLPFLPQQKLGNKLVWKEGKKGLSAYLANEWYFTQYLTAPAERKTPSYSLLHAGISYILTKNDRHYTLSIQGTNLGNVAYFNHMSRLKNFGLLNMGRNVMLSFKMNWISTIKNK